MSEKRLSAKKDAATALLAVLSLVLSYVESLIPFELLIPVPGFKLGLANIVLLFSVFTLPLSYTIAVFLLKVCLTALLFGTPVSFAMSFSGGLLSVIGMLVTKSILKEKVGPIGVSAVGSVLHNIGQLAAASAILSGPVMWNFFPVLVLTGLGTGIITGIAAAFLFRSVRNLKFISS